MVKYSQTKCMECLHKMGEHNANGKCRKFLLKGRARFICDCKIYVKKRFR